MPTTVAIRSPHRHPRLRYVLKVLSQDLGYQFRLYTDPDKWEQCGSLVRVTYGGTPSGAGIPHWPASRLLSGSPPCPADLAVEWRQGLPYFLGDDLLACCFYQLSRYEEYQPFTPDQHDRFSASNSHAFREGYLQLPVVRMWARRLADHLRRSFPDLPPPRERAFTFRPTYDIDLLWAYQHRSWRGIASGIKDLLTGSWNRCRERLRSAPDQDPFFRLDYLLDLHPEQRATVFWLLADNSVPEDANPYPIPEAQKTYMQVISQRAEMGIHPGYATTQNSDKLTAELLCLQAITGRPPTRSRQHFLRLRLPETYRQLRQHGITHDHSMGYADAVGWRAGTNLPFFWYDLEQESATGLTIHPFAAMDGTLKSYLQLSPAAGYQEILQLAEDCRSLGGDFALLWHNSSLSPTHGWAGWEKVYAETVKALRDG